MRRTHDDRGAALVEFAVVAGFLVLLVLGAAEWGFAFKDWLGVSAGSRAGARIAAQAGDQEGADCRILESTGGAIRGLNGRIVEVEIFKADEDGRVDPGASQIYRPRTSDDTEDLVVCGSWVGPLLGSNWPEASRDNKGDVRDWVGVDVTFEHDWITGFPGFTGSVTWSDDTIMRVEPDPTPDIG